MNQEHALSLLTDYVLDLLTPAERAWVEEHATVCDGCRRAMQREKQLTLALGHTLHLAAQPGAARLQALMPPPPQPLADPRKAGKAVSYENRPPTKQSKIADRRPQKRGDDRFHSWWWGAFHVNSPQIAQRASRRNSWLEQLAPVTMVLVLLVGSLWLYTDSPSATWRNSVPGYVDLVATERAATATATVTATSSATSPPTTTTLPVATLAQAINISVGQTAAPQPVHPETAATPIVQGVETVGD